MGYPLTYSLAVGPFAFLLREIRGREALSRPWQLRARFVLDPQTMRGEPSAFSPDAVIRQTATIVLDRAGVEQRRIRGIVTDVSLAAAVTGAPEVAMTIEPRLSLLGHRRDIRIHRELTVPQIVTQVAEALGVQIDNRLIGSYPVRHSCVQWRETDLNYVSRLLEDEGIFYYFTSDDVMVLGDSPRAYEPIAGEQLLAFRDAAGANMNDDAVHEIGARAALTPGKVTLRDWNTEHPSLDMDVSHPNELGFGPEWYDYPGEYDVPDEGKRKARLHAEAFDREAFASLGRTTCARLYPGAVFELQDAPPGCVDSGGDDGRYVVRALDHDWRRDECPWEAAFELQDAETTYRPPRDTYVPTVFNPMTGFITTAPGEDIHCDHFGRVKVHFPWDRNWPMDDTCSYWIPAVQDNTGGSSAIPRKNWEVLCNFQEGDPDRPVVLGRVYNATDNFEEKLPHAKYRSGLRSMTTPSRIGSNEIRLEDWKGAERVMVHAELDQLINIANDLSRDVGANDTLTVVHDETVQIGGNADWHIADDTSPTIAHDQTWQVGGDREHKVGGSRVTTVDKDRNVKIGADYERKIFSEDRVGAKTMTEKIGSNLTEKYKTSYGLQTNETELKLNSSFTRKVGEDLSEATNDDRTEKVGSDHVIAAQGEIKMRTSASRAMTVQGNYSAACPKTLGLTGADEFETQSNSGDWSASADITFKVKDTVVELKGGLVRITAPSAITISIRGPATEGSSQSEQN